MQKNIFIPLYFVLCLPLFAMNANDAPMKASVAKLVDKIKIIEDLDALVTVLSPQNSLDGIMKLLAEPRQGSAITIAEIIGDALIAAETSRLCTATAPRTFNDVLDRIAKMYPARKRQNPFLLVPGLSRAQKLVLEQLHSGHRIPDFSTTFFGAELHKTIAQCINDFQQRVAREYGVAPILVFSNAVITTPPLISAAVKFKAPDYHEHRHSPSITTSRCALLKRSIGFFSSPNLPTTMKGCRR